MDKNMINIDDLLRQRLGNAEEQERPGAWANMRDVLDKQMPVGKAPAAAGNWRKMFGALAVVAILAVVSVGGYQMSHTFSTEGDIAENNTTPSQEDYTAATTGLAGTAINALPDTRVEAETAAQPAPATDAANSNISTQNTVASNNTSANGAPSANNTYASSSNNKSLNNSKLNSVSESNNSTNNSPKSNNNSNTNPNSGINNTAGTLSNTSSDDKSTTPNKPANNKAANTGTTASNNTPESVDNKNNAGNTQAKDNSKAKQATDKLETGDMQSNKVAKNEPKFKEVPEKKYEVEQKVGRDGKPYLDTVNTEDGVRKIKQSTGKGQLAKNNSDNNASGSEMKPSSSAPKAKSEANEENADMEKLGDHLVKSKKIKNYNPHRFEEMVQNAKLRMGNIKFYPGIVGGANMAFNGNVGFQIGLALDTKVSDRWSILTEVKYAYRFNGGNNKVKMQDDYIDNVKPTVVNGQGVYTYDSMEHYFNFNNYGVLDIPVLLQYKNNAFTFMAGVDFNYNFKINSLQEVEQIYASEKPRTSTSNPVFSTEKTILLSDFAPTMNLGPMIGAGYQMNAAWKLDLRMSKPMWNNASTFGQKEIAKNLYSKPQVQLNLTWKIPSMKPAYKRNR